MNNLLAASISNPALSGPITTLNGTTFVQRAVPISITILLTIGVLFFFFNFLIGGLNYISAGGDKVKLEAAKGKLSGAIIGILIMFAFMAVITLVGNILGTSLTVLNLDSIRIK